MVGRGHTNETVGLLNVNSIQLNTFFDGKSWSNRVFKCIEFTFDNPTISLL
jgi:hypothetical protein